MNTTANDTCNDEDAGYDNDEGERIERYKQWMNASDGEKLIRKVVSVITADEW
jgi:hypothetical protein